MTTTITKKNISKTLGSKMHLDNFMAEDNSSEDNSSKDNSSKDLTFVKKPVNENLKFSLPCKFVSGDDFEKTGEYGSCFKHECWHAHSLDQWVPARCTYNGECRNERCTFYHPIFEDIDMWLKRTKKSLPNLPARLVIRQPKQTLISKSLMSKSLLIPSQVNMEKIRNLHIEVKNTPVISSLQEEKVEKVEDFELEQNFSELKVEKVELEQIVPATKKISEDSVPIIRCSTDTLLVFAIQECASRGKFNFDARLSDNSDKQSNKNIIVTVPTENIAKFTIKTFFDIGQFDIDIRVSK